MRNVAKSYAAANFAQSGRLMHRMSARAGYPCSGSMPC